MCDPTAIMFVASAMSSQSANKARREQKAAVEDSKKQADAAAINKSKQRKTVTGGKERRKTGRGILNVSSPSTSGSPGY